MPIPLLKKIKRQVDYWKIFSKRLGNLHMHILILPSFYPELHRPLNGLFVKNQSRILINEVDKIGTVYVEQKSLRKLFVDIKSNIFHKSSRYDEGILTYRIHGLNMLNQYKLGTKLWIKLTENLVKDYIEVNGKPDLIHAHNVFNGGRAALHCLNKFKIPYVITEHASGFLLNEYSIKQLNTAKEVFRKSHRTIAVSNNLAKAIEFSCNISDVKVVPNVVDTEKFKLPLKDEKHILFTFISVGNLLENKGHHILIEAFKNFTQKFPNSQLIIFGEGPEHKNLLKLTDNLNLGKSVFLKGRISPSNSVKKYQRAHCLVLPSLKETFGIVLIEAMACGLPIIATKSGGPDGIINDQSGLLVEPGNVYLMTRKMVELYKNFKKYDEDFLHNYVKNNFGHNAITKKLISLYLSSGS